MARSMAGASAISATWATALTATALRARAIPWPSSTTPPRSWPPEAASHPSTAAATTASPRWPTAASGAGARNQWGQVGDGTTTDRYLPVTTNFTLPSLEVSPASLTIAQIVGTTSAPQVVTLANAGGATLTIASINSNSSELVRTGTTCPPVAPPETGWAIAGGASCTFSFTSRPASRGARRLVRDHLELARESSALQSDAHGSRARRDSSGLGFPSTWVGTTSAAQAATITNNLAVAVNFTGFTVTPPFVNTGAGSCGASLDPGASCTVSIAFAPRSRGRPAARSPSRTAGPARTSSWGSRARGPTRSASRAPPPSPRRWSEPRAPSRP